MSKSSVLRNTTDSTGAYEAVTLFAIRLQNDDVQDFDVQWDSRLIICA